VITAAVITNTLLQTEAPEHLRGRVIGFYAFIVVGLAPFGSLQAGWVGEHLGIRSGAAIGGLMCLGGALWIMRKTGTFSRRPAAERRVARIFWPWGERRRT